jgi:hypothetical protein
LELQENDVAVDANKMTSSNGCGYVDGTPRLFIRIESAAVALAAMIAYRQLGEPWWLFAALFLAPDLSMIGYLAGPRVGALLYNVVHVYAGPAILVGFGFLSGSVIAQALASIWFAHIGFDRMLGYGLKYGQGFAFTHLGRLGFRANRQSASP